MIDLEKVIEHAGKDVGHALAYPFVNTEHFVKLLDEIVKDSPKVKVAILDLITQASVVDADVLAAIAAKGMNLPADLMVLKDAAAFFQYFRTQFVPLCEQVYKDLNLNAATS